MSSQKSITIRPLKLSNHSSYHESGDDPCHESFNNQNYGKKTANHPGDTEKMEETLLLQPAIISTAQPGLAPRPRIYTRKEAYDAYDE